MPTKKYDRTWDTICNRGSGELIYTEVIWSSKFGSAWVTMRRDLYQQFEESKEKYFSDFMKKNNITVGTLK
jgi:hypothetical protein